MYLVGFYVYHRSYQLWSPVVNSALVMKRDMGQGGLILAVGRVRMKKQNRNRHANRHA